jgi:hypothetical protein
VLENSQETHIRRSKKGKWDCIAIGSAYCRYGIDFTDTGINGYNLGFGSQFFYYTNKILLQYSKYCNTGSYVLIICADLVFAEVGKGLYESHRYYRVLDKKMWNDEYSLKGDLKYNILPIFFQPKLIKKCLLRLKGIDYNARYNKVIINELSEEEVKQSANNRCRDWVDQFGLVNTISPNLSSDLEKTFIKTRAILEEMIDYCLSNNLKPILVVTPVSEQLNKNLSDEFIYSVLLKNIKIANTHNVPVMNYLRDKRFADFKLYHNNADFLNVTGRRLFTKILLSDIKNMAI